MRHHFCSCQSAYVSSLMSQVINKPFTTKEITESFSREGMEPPIRIARCRGAGSRMLRHGTSPTTSCCLILCDQHGTCFLMRVRCAHRHTVSGLPCCGSGRSPSSPWPRTQDGTVVGPPLAPSCASPLARFLLQEKQSGRQAEPGHRITCAICWLRLLGQFPASKMRPQELP